MSGTEKLAQLRALAKANRTGGKGSMRRTKKVVHRANSANEEKKYRNTMKKLQMQNINDIAEVNMFKEDGDVLHFANPTVEANMSCRTMVVSGVQPENKGLQELLPDILSQIGQDSINTLRRLAEKYQSTAGEGSGAAAGAMPEVSSFDD